MNRLPLHASAGRDREVAQALQRVLLPPRLPDIPGWAVAALYQPAGEAVLVGGDFYDWFDMRDGRLALMVGDVSGKGPAAGALGMSIRKVLKGLLWLEPDPARALPVVEEVLAAELPDATFASLVVALVGEEGRVELFSAGHPPPWRIGPRGARELAIPANGLINVGVPAPWSGTEVTLGPGESLVLYSDGLVENRTLGAPFRGLEVLAESAPRLTGVSVTELVVGLSEAAAGPDGHFDDDVLVVALQRSPSQAAAPARAVGRP